MPRLIYLAYLVAYCISPLGSRLSGLAGPTVAQIIFKALHYFTQPISLSLCLSRARLSIDLISVLREAVRLKSSMISIMYSGASFDNLYHVGLLYRPAVRWTPGEAVV